MHQKRKQQLILFKKRSANIFVQQPLESVNKEFLSPLFVVFLQSFIIRGLKSSHIYFFIEFKRILIHGVYVHQVCKHKKETT